MSRRPIHMARPRVFISSTFYDLHQVRSDIERFIREMGYDPVQHERGNVPYGSTEKLETYCYKEIGAVDIVVCIIGGRFGSASVEQTYSISQMELKTAIKLNKQVYVCIDADVLAEYRTYLRNKELDIRYAAADDKRIFKFIEEIEALPSNNQIISFTDSNGIVAMLREQWAGLFQRFLQAQEQAPERRMAEEMQTALETLNQLTKFLTEDRRQQGSAIDSILLANHPAFLQLKKLLNSPYPLFLPKVADLRAWLTARSWTALSDGDDEDYAEWFSENGEEIHTLRINTELFDGKRIRTITPDEWNPKWITVTKQKKPAKAVEFEDFPIALVDDDDDLPF